MGGRGGRYRLGGMGEAGPEKQASQRDQGEMGMDSASREMGMIKHGCMGNIYR